MKIRELISIIIALSFILSLVEFGYKVTDRPSPVIEKVAVNYVIPAVNKLSHHLVPQEEVKAPEVVVNCQEEPEACLD